jgi:predicted nucleic acid-binding protein
VGTLILDASVLTGLLDVSDVHHVVAVDDVEAADQARHSLLVPASAYSESLVAFARAGRVSDAREAIAAMGIVVTPLSAAVAERAASLRAEHERLRLPDALVLATAREHGGDLLTYDDELKQIADRSGAGPGGGGVEIPSTGPRRFRGNVAQL